MRHSSSALLALTTVLGPMLAMWPSFSALLALATVLERIAGAHGHVAAWHKGTLLLISSLYPT